MKQNELQFSTVVGNSTDTRWSQVRSDVIDPSNSIFMAVDVSGAELMDLPMYGSLYMESVKDKYFVSESHSLDKLKGVVGDVLKGVQEGLEVSIVAVVVHGDVMYVVGKGSVSVFLVRGGAAHKIFSGSGSIGSLSGQLQRDDVFVVSTADFVNILGKEIVRAAVSDSPPDEILAPIVHNQKDSSGLAGLLVAYDSAEVADEVVGTTPKSVGKSLEFGSGLKKVFDKVRSRAGDRSLKVKREDASRKSSYLAFAVLILLLISVVFGAWRRSNILKDRKYSEVEQQIQQQMDEVVSIADLNPERARYLLLESKKAVDKYISDTSDESYVKKGQFLVDFIDQTEEKALRRSEVDVSPIVDLDVISTGAKFSGFYLDEEGNALMYDKNSSVIHGFNLSDKSSFEVGKVDGVMDISYYNDRVFSVGSGGVVASNLEGGDSEVVVEQDDVFENIQFIDMFAGNIYLLDRGTGEIWKYPVLDDGWGSRRRWFATGIVLDLSNVIDFRVDGDIWLLTSTGKLERYSRGAPVDFSMEGFADRFSDPASVFVTEENVYVLERGERRVVVFDIEGKYVRQYVAEDFTNGLDFVVSEDVGYVLTSSQIVSFSLSE